MVSAINAKVGARTLEMLGELIASSDAPAWRGGEPPWFVAAAGESGGSALVQQLLALEECSGVTIDSLTASLPEDARPWARDALAGVDVSARPAPTNMPEPKPRAPAKPRKRVADAGEEAEPKPAKKPRTAARKPYVKKAAEEDVEDNRQEALSDGEAID